MTSATGDGSGTPAPDGVATQASAGSTPSGVTAAPAPNHKAAPEGNHLTVVPDPDNLSAAELAKLIDHTLLKPEATRAAIEQLCGEARAWGIWSVCVNPVWVETAAELLAGSGVLVCTVVGFPLGATLSEAKAAEARLAVACGAREVDMVLDVGGLKSGDDARVQADVAAVAAVCREHGALLKVILETALLSDEEKVRAAGLAVEAGAGFVKTSTGFGPGGATVPDVALLRRTVGPAIGVKASGGIRTLDAARAMLRAGANRLGLSGTVPILQALQSEGAGRTG